ncbi:MAG: Gfo/Idh/MocA family oxidoreductase, partial [Ponticaulis sp.]|nr:Gfo/Idh/MocA family oxidoreductase [Ponticaulis sp.]
MTKLKVGVAGAGVFGTYHAQKAAASASTELIGIFDIDKSRAQSAALPFGVAGFDDFDHFLAECDAVIVAVPATFHGAMVERALESE